MYSYLMNTAPASNPNADRNVAVRQVYYHKWGQVLAGFLNAHSAQLNA